MSLLEAQHAVNLRGQLCPQEVLHVGLGAELAVRSPRPGACLNGIRQGGAGLGKGPGLVSPSLHPPWYLGTARISGKGGEDLAKHPALLSIQYLIPVEMVELGTPAAKHQSHGGRLQPCEQHGGLEGPLSLEQSWHLQATLA